MTAVLESTTRHRRQGVIAVHVEPYGTAGQFRGLVFAEGHQGQQLQPEDQTG